MGIEHTHFAKLLYCFIYNYQFFFKYNSNIREVKVSKIIFWYLLFSFISFFFLFFVGVCIKISNVEPPVMGHSFSTYAKFSEKLTFLSP